MRVDCGGGVHAGDAGELGTGVGGVGVRLGRFALLLLTAGFAAGQTFAPTGDLKFEAATIKPTPQDAPRRSLRASAGGKRYAAAGETLHRFLWIAYQVKAEQITGGPDWIDTARFDLNAEAAKPSSLEDLGIMLQNLLTERFKLRFHFKKKQMKAYVLTQDKEGAKNLKAHPNPTGGDVHLDQYTENVVHQRWNAHCASLDFFAWRLSQKMDAPVLNQTGLTGCFDFGLEFTEDLPPGVQDGQVVNGAVVDTYGLTIYQELPKQLGLRLEYKRAPVETMVIDHAEKPTDN